MWILSDKADIIFSMSPFWKSFFHSSNKHKKLCEDFINNREPVVDGMTFYVCYLGSSVVDDPKSSQSTAAGVKRVIQAAKLKSGRPEKVSFRVAMEGVRVESTATGRTLMDTSIYKISYCSADSHYEQVLAFVASNEDETCECHAFLCVKRKQAEAIAVSIAQAFTMAYECWKRAVEEKRTAEQSRIAGRGDESPSRHSNGGERSSRASSPEHSPGRSSPPSEVSSTSGYQSSIICGLLLELDYTDAGSDEAPAPQLLDPPSGASRPRKHWTSFDDVSDLADDFLRLSSGPAMNSCPWVHRTNPSATQLGSSRLELRGSSKSPLSPPARTIAGCAMKAPLPCALAATTPTVDTVAAATPSLTQSRNSCCAATRELHQLHQQPPQTSQPARGRCDGTVLPPAATAHTDPVAFLGLSTTRSTISDIITNPINHPDAKSTNLTNMTKVFSRPEYIANRLSEDSSILHTRTSSSRAFCRSENYLSSSVGAERARSIEGRDVDAWQSGAAMAFCLIDGGISVPRDKWESFDSSPSPTSALTSTSLSTPMSHTPSVSSTTFTVTIPTTSSSSMSFSKLSSSSSSRRPLSPNSAFLDSCLTPRLEEDDCKGPRFSFIGRLSGEGRIFTTNSLSSNPINGLFSLTPDSKKLSFPNKSNGNNCLGNGKIGADLESRNLANFSRSSDSFSPQSPPPEAVR